MLFTEIKAIAERNAQKAVAISENAAPSILDESKSWRFNVALKILKWLVSSEISKDNLNDDQILAVHAAIKIESEAALK